MMFSLESVTLILFNTSYLLIFIIIRIVFVRISALMSTKASLNQLKLYRLVYQVGTHFEKYIPFLQELIEGGHGVSLTDIRDIIKEECMI